MAHKFNPENMHVLDMEERKKIFPPEGALAAAGLKEGDVFADIGCGTGYLSIPAARLVGEQGRVYGFDTSEKMLEELKRRVEQEGLVNVFPVRAGEYEMPAPGDCCTHAVVSSVFHEVDDRSRFARASEKNPCARRQAFSVRNETRGSRSRSPGAPPDIAGDGEKRPRYGGFYRYRIRRPDRTFLLCGRGKAAAVKHETAN